MEQQRDLGNRLAHYWDMGRDTVPKPAPRSIPSHGEEIDTMLSGLREKQGERLRGMGMEVVT